MNKEERIKLVFETLSKLAGFEIKPDKEFYMTLNGYKEVCKIDENLNLHYNIFNGTHKMSDYNILPIFRGGYQLEEIKEPLLAFEEKEFLSQFEFEWLEISTTLDMYDKNNEIVASIKLTNIFDNDDVNFDGLEKGKRYSRKELAL